MLLGALVARRFKLVPCKLSCRALFHQLADRPTRNPKTSRLSRCLQLRTTSPGTSQVGNKRPILQRVGWENTCRSVWQRTASLSTNINIHRKSRADQRSCVYGIDLRARASWREGPTQLRSCRRTSHRCMLPNALCDHFTTCKQPSLFVADRKQS